MNVRFNGSHYIIPLGSGTTDPKLTLSIPESQALIIALAKEMSLQNDLPEPEIANCLSDIYLHR